MTVLMKAARIHEFGDASVIRDDDVPRPVAAPGTVLLRVSATSFNPTEAALRAGLLQSFLPVALPYTLGMDVSGTITELGPDVHGFKVGGEVVGRLDAAGAAAEYVAAPADTIVTAPSSIPLESAAALPVAGLTAWQAVTERGRVAPGERVLINGAGGGVGGFVTQLAKAAGAHVTATASPRSAEAVARQGADTVIDYTATPVTTVLKGTVDALINLVPLSPTAAAALPQVVRPGGRIISIATPLEPAADAGITSQHMVARNDVTHLAALVELVDAGALTVDVSRSFPLADMAQVHRLSEAGELRGKVILLP